MKKFLVVLLCIIGVFLLSGCIEGSTVNVNVENSSNLAGTVFGKSALFEIGDGLYYDTTTRIVYWWNGVLRGDSHVSSTPSPYYASNGLPYRYNPENNCFEEI